MSKTITAAQVQSILDACPASGIFQRASRTTRLAARINEFFAEEPDPPMPMPGMPVFNDRDGSCSARLVEPAPEKDAGWFVQQVEDLTSRIAALDKKQAGSLSNETRVQIIDSVMQRVGSMDLRITELESVSHHNDTRVTQSVDRISVLEEDRERNKNFTVHLEDRIEALEQKDKGIKIGKVKVNLVPNLAPFILKKASKKRKA